jgi:hypothetical protein
MRSPTEGSGYGVQAGLTTARYISHPDAMATRSRTVTGIDLSVPRLVYSVLRIEQSADRHEQSMRHDACFSFEAYGPLKSSESLWAICPFTAVMNCVRQLVNQPAGRISCIESQMRIACA